MKALRFSKFGPPSVLAVAEVPRPTMTSRREFLDLAMRGSALAAAEALMVRDALASGDDNKKGTTDAMQNVTERSSQGHYKPPFKFGMGGVPIGNEFSVVTDEDANAILEAAWSAGVRYYDVSPCVWVRIGRAKVRLFSS